MCGAPARAAFRAPAAEQAPDLDGRPGEPARSTLPRWVQVCPRCGAAGPDLTALPAAAAEMVAGAAYRAEDNAFLRWAAILEATGGDAGEALLQAAWLSDDAGDDAAGLRRRAAAAWWGDGLRKVDILRRAGAFAEARAAAAALTELDETARAVVAFQLGRIAAGDAGRHSIASALRPPARTPHVTHGRRPGGLLGRIWRGG